MKNSDKRGAFITSGTFVAGLNAIFIGSAFVHPEKMRETLIGIAAIDGFAITSLIVIIIAYKLFPVTKE